MSNVDDLELDDNVEDLATGGYEIVPGKYLAKVVSAEIRERSAEKRIANPDDPRENKFILFELNLIDCLDEKQEQSLGNSVYEAVGLGPKTQWKIAAICKAALPDLEGKKIPLAKLPKSMLQITVVVEPRRDSKGKEIEGEEQFRSKRWKPAEGWEGIKFTVEDGVLQAYGGGSSGIDDEGDQPKSNGSNKPAKTGARTQLTSSSNDDDDEVDLADI